ncbi:hypothetical protein FKP32DRAFT_643802 [Trametes sanguinea]|nr:hypothetical protein FKP32DRAFT_643802 [Trametes sanguinea]
MSPRVDPPYPSFTFALSKSQATPSLPPESIVIRHSDPGTASRSPSSRLPPYRASHMGRFHPYPRAAPLRRGEDRLMNTVDYRYAEEPLWEEAGVESVRTTPLARLPQLASSIGLSELIVSQNDDAAALEGDPADLPVAAADGAHIPPAMGTESAATLPPPAVLGLSKSAFLMTLSDMLAALRRRYLSPEAVKSFLKTQQFKSG